MARYVLTSAQLKDSARLQDCANDHKYHVGLTNPPEKGDHVESIHEALATLGFHDIYVPELLGHYFGESTADAVFRFKNSQKPKILGPGQSVPDKIVGVQTIRALDRLLGGADPNAVTFEIKPAKALWAHVVWLSTIQDSAGFHNPIPSNFKAGNALLAKHGMKFAMTSGTNPVEGDLVAFAEELNDHAPGPNGTLGRARKAAVAAANPDPGVILVVVGKFMRPFSPAGRIRAARPSSPTPGILAGGPSPRRSSSTTGVRRRIK